MAKHGSNGVDGVFGRGNLQVAPTGSLFLLRSVGRRIDAVLRIVLRPFQIVSNFVFLTVAYFLGIGLSSFFYRLGPGRKKEAVNPPTYWQEVPPAPKDRDAWLRPF